MLWPLNVVTQEMLFFSFEKNRFSVRHLFRWLILSLCFGKTQTVDQSNIIRKLWGKFLFLHSFKKQT